MVISFMNGPVEDRNIRQMIFNCAEGTEDRLVHSTRKYIHLFMLQFKDLLYLTRSGILVPNNLLHKIAVKVITIP